MHKYKEKTGKQRRTLQRQVEQKDSFQPIQQRDLTPNGSASFVNLAQKMGLKYGVDTSPLRASHNSSFPGKLQAAATIQGADIHFAPGQDSTFNMKHEIGHYIDNVKNGSPVADSVIDGQAINTTREAAADTYANAPV